ncbi:MAG: hypothetical protein HOV77_17150 [Hamadaea sp.]|uniref:hypothetical protein n=1 Tax=Hamadaea sp. TaxID=2024425 RepID=UPI001841CC06|nr:hypothetical protein [Hamadaea sp.]NUT20909.1 hypothetical protein [Hamadaea sp.]
MRLSRLIASASVVLALAVSTLATTGTPAAAVPTGLPYGYDTAQTFGLGPDASCKLHLKGDWHSFVQYKDPFFWVRSILISDAVFAEGDYCQIGPYTLEQSDGDLRLLRPDGVALWCLCYLPGTSTSKPFYAYFQGFDGNLVSYTWAGGEAVRATNTCCATRRHLALQTDGNLVIYQYNAVYNTYTAVWASNTAQG